jgi:K+-sensing histidine kinase KdpD
MVGDILDASSLATGKLRLDAMPVDVVRLFADATSAFQTAASAAGIALEFDCTASACVVSGDAERLRQMLSNLVSNALKFTPAGGAVTVTLTHDAAHAVLAVGDTGQGIASSSSRTCSTCSGARTVRPRRRGAASGSACRSCVISPNCTAARSASTARRNRGATFTVTLPAGWQPIGAMAWA